MVQVLIEFKVRTQNKAIEKDNKNKEISLFS
jgi:hypothetical protein